MLDTNMLLNRATHNVSFRLNTNEYAAMIESSRELNLSLSAYLRHVLRASNESKTNAE
jgi:hypothetical protein